jgi:transcriptional regulator with XRE-family HTH domain
MNIVDGKQIRAARALLGWSQRQLADEAGLNPATIGQLECSSAYAMPGRHQTVCKVLGVLERAGIRLEAHGVQVGAVGLTMEKRHA